MKKTIFALMAAAAFGLAGCQKTGQSSPAEEAAGSYTGEMTITIFGTANDPIPQTIDIAASGDDAIDLGITDFSAMGIEIGAITLPGCPVVRNEEDGTITVTTEQTLSLDTVGDCDIVLDGSFKNGQAVLDLNITPSVFPTDVAVRFEGTKAE